jgi:hypothetical protein
MAGDGELVGLGLGLDTFTVKFGVRGVWTGNWLVYEAKMEHISTGIEIYLAITFQTFTLLTT